MVESGFYSGDAAVLACALGGTERRASRVPLNFQNYVKEDVMSFSETFYVTFSFKEGSNKMYLNRLLDAHVRENDRFISNDYDR
jgi:hypothetical protein